MRSLLVTLAVAFLFSCSSSPAAEFRPYRACVIDVIGGRQLIDTGTVVGKEGRLFLFRSDRHPDDGRHIQKVERIRRPCAAAGGADGLGLAGGRTDPPEDRRRQ
jgi:hypothetical protein